MYILLVDNNYMKKYRMECNDCESTIRLLFRCSRSWMMNCLRKFCRAPSRCRHMCIVTLSTKERHNERNPKCAGAQRRSSDMTSWTNGSTRFSKRPKFQTMWPSVKPCDPYIIDLLQVLLYALPKTNRLLRYNWRYWRPGVTCHMTYMQAILFVEI